MLVSSGSFLTVNVTVPSTAPPTHTVLGVRATETAGNLGVAPRVTTLSTAQPIPKV